ncbi:MAG: ATP phosphoribosyltransferase [Caldilineales bacterium]|nr:ATP phosphoribosyltransferase [Caldilineales bacterium]
MLTVALPKGRLADEALVWLGRAGWPLPVGENERRLIVPSHDPNLSYLLTKPMDVPVFVEQGAADMGITGLDVLRERGADVFEPLRLPFGYCRLSVAAPADRPDRPLRLEISPRVATKYPRLADAFFRRRGISAELIVLSGSVELGPLVNLADLIVDLVETGETLRANGLVELRPILHSQAVLIVNRASYRLHTAAIAPLIAALRAVIEERKREESEGAC